MQMAHKLCRGVNACFCVDGGLVDNSFFYEGRNIHQTKNHFQVIIKPFINKCKLKLTKLFATIHTEIH